MREYTCQHCGFVGQHDEMWLHSFMVHQHDQVEPEPAEPVTTPDYGPL